MSRRENRALLDDIVAQAAMEQEQGREQYSDKLVTMIEKALTRMGTPEPTQHRFNLEGLSDLIEERAGGSSQDDSWRRLPIVVQTAEGGPVRFWMTVEIETVTERVRVSDEEPVKFRAVVLTPMN